VPLYKFTMSGREIVAETTRPDFYAHRLLDAVGDYHLCDVPNGIEGRFGTIVTWELVNEDS